MNTRMDVLFVRFVVYSKVYTEPLNHPNYLSSSIPTCLNHCFTRVVTIHRRSVSKNEFYFQGAGISLTQSKF